MTLYVLVPTAVYDHGVIGIYNTEQEAIDAAAEIWPATDGHHAFMIYPREIGTSQFHVFTHSAFTAEEWEGDKQKKQAKEMTDDHRSRQKFRIYKEGQT